MQTLKFIGRGSAFNTKEGNNSAYIIQKDDLFLFDCGESIFERIQDKNLLKGIKNLYVFVTHNHSDHIGSLSSLLHYCHYIKKINVDIYVAQNQDLDAILKLHGNSDEQYTFHNCFYFEKQIIKDNFEIEFIPVKHSQELTCSGFIIYAEFKHIYYSGDTSCVSTLLLDRILLFSEIYHDTCLADYDGNVHTSLRKLSDSVPKKYRNKFYCMHLDCDELIDKAKQLGFNVVEVEK